MKRIALTNLLLLFVTIDLYAWDITNSVGGRTNSLGKCSVALSDFWSLHNNPAGFATINDLSIGISYGNRFLLKELSNKDAGILLPINIGTIGISFSQFGYEHYNENLFGLGLSRSFGQNLRIGLKLYYMSIRFSEEYENRSVPTFDLGIQYQINKSLCLGAYIFNPINVRIGSLNKDKVPIIMRLGFAYHIVDEFMICGEIEENFDDDFSFRFGLEYEAYKNVFVRSGFQLMPCLFTFGIGYDYKRFVVDVAAQMNQDLGVSMSCSMVFKMNGINKM